MDNDGAYCDAIVIDVAIKADAAQNVRGLRRRFPAAWICAARAASDDVGTQCLEDGADAFTTIDDPHRKVVATIIAGAHRAQYDAASFRIRLGDLV